MNANICCNSEGVDYVEKASNTLSLLTESRKNQEALDAEAPISINTITTTTITTPLLP